MIGGKRAPRGHAAIPVLFILSGRNTVTLGRGSRRAHVLRCPSMVLHTTPCFRGLLEPQTVVAGYALLYFSNTMPAHSESCLLERTSTLPPPLPVLAPTPSFDIVDLEFRTLQYLCDLMHLDEAASRMADDVTATTMYPRNVTICILYPRELFFPNFLWSFRISSNDQTDIIY